MSLMNNFQRRGPYTFQIPTIGSQYLLNAESSQFKQSLIYLYVASKNIFLVFDWGPPHSALRAVIGSDAPSGRWERLGTWPEPDLYTPGAEVFCVSFNCSKRLVLGGVSVPMRPCSRFRSRGSWLGSGFQVNMRELILTKSHIRAMEIRF